MWWVSTKGFLIAIVIVAGMATALFIIGSITETEVPQQLNITHQPDARELSATENLTGVDCQSGVCNTSTCVVDYTHAPNMSGLAPRVAKLCEVNYPKIQQLLSNNALPLPHVIIFQENPLLQGKEAVGIANGSVIQLSGEWFLQHPDDLGAIVHEIAHVVQAYPPGNYSWLVEGIADYVRHRLGYNNSWSYPHCGLGSENYTSGYWCTSAFLGFVEKNYDSGTIISLNHALRNGTYSDSIFGNITGKPINELWDECKRNDCQRGTP